MARRKGSRKYHKKGGSGAAYPNSYTDSQSYMRATVGSGDQQWDNVFKQGSSNSNSNTIVGLQGQKAGGSRRRRRRSKRGGFWGSVINQAIVPFGILGLQQSYRRKHVSNGTRKFRRH
jgi:hypothetical protein